MAANSRPQVSTVSVVPLCLTRRHIPTYNRSRSLVEDEEDYGGRKMPRQKVEGLLLLLLRSMRERHLRTKSEFIP